MKAQIWLWLDDIRLAPPGWLHVKTDAEARMYLRRGGVRALSLDHDLGACDACLAGRSAEAWLKESDFQSMPNCEHVGTGYTLLCWMEQSGCWPMDKPTIHSRNPVGRARMQAVINRRYGE